LNDLDHLVMAGLGSDFTWAVVGLRKGKITDEGG
jgi:hypothetical protein